MKTKRIFLLALCLILTLSSAVFPTVLAVGASALEKSYDYSREGSYFNTTVSSADIFDLLGISITDAESAYLDAYGSLKIRYEAVTTQNISVSTVDGNTIVTARPYTYTGVNGESVTWTALSATIGAYTVDFSDGKANFGKLTLNGDDTVSVEYEMTSIDIEAADINEVLNRAYYEADLLKIEIDKYNDNIDEINEYLADLAAYEKYLSDKLVYDQRSEDYSNYLAELDAYEKALAKYEKYQEDLKKYLDVKNHNEQSQAQYQSELEKYNKYLADLELVKAQVAILDNGLMSKVETASYKGDKARQLYGCLFANLVDEVVAKKDQLTKIGAEKEDIDACAVASDNIRAILKPDGGTAYTSLSTVEDKYAFYINNYEALRDNIIVLTQSLYSIYSKDGVKATMHVASDLLGREDYTERLAIFIAQLIYFSNALSDDPVMSKDGKKVLDGNTVLSYRDINGKDQDNVKISDILLGNVFVADNGNAAPITIVSVPEPTPPDLLPETDPPTEVAKPIAPHPVSDPGDEPEVKTCPTRPSCVPEDLSRLDILANQIYLDLVDNIASLGGGDRETINLNETETVTYTPTVTLVKKIYATDMVEVTFTDTDGSVITTVGVDKGTAVNFTDTLPTKQEDASATYVFAAWVTSDGTEYDLSAVDQSVTLYPSFDPIYKEYSVSGDGSSKYLDVNVSSSGDTLECVPLTHFIDIARKNLSAIRFSDGSVTVSIPYAYALEMADSGVDSLNISHDTSTIGSYTFNISALTALGGEAPAISGISVSIPCSDTIFANDSVLTYADSEGNVREVNKLYSSGAIAFRAITGVPYTISLKYMITANPNLDGIVSAPADAAPGETVELGLTVPEGVTLELYYTLLSDYSKHAIEGNSFDMPYGNIILGGKLTNIEYTVKFVSDGKVLSAGIYHYGDTVKVPKNPGKLPDGEYSYSFTGWSPEITTVTGDVIYVAQFAKTLLPEVEKKISWFNVLFYSAVSVFSLGIVALVLFILNKKKIISIKGIFAAIKQKIARVWGKITSQKVEKAPVEDGKTPENSESEQKNEENNEEKSRKG